MTLYRADSNCQLRTGSPNTVRNEQVCAHQKSYEQEVNFPKQLWAIMHLSDRSCAPIFQFFDAALDGATANRQIPDRIFGHF